MVNYFLAQGAKFLNEKNFIKALALADSAAVYAKKKDDIHFFKGNVFTELGRFTKANHSFINTLKINPNYRGAWNKLGNNAFQQQNFDQAVKYYKKELIQKETSISYCGLGKAFVELGKVDSARICFHKAIDLDNNLTDAYLYLAKLEGSEGNLNKAFQVATRAYELDANNVENQYVYNTILVQMDKGIESILSLKEVVKKWPWHPGAHYNLGRALIQSGEKLEGEQFLDKSKKARADQAKIDHLENIVRDSQDDPYSYNALAFALRNVGRFKDSLHSYKIALYLDPNNYDIWNNVARLYLLQGDTVNALNTYNFIVNKNPSLIEVWLDMGSIYSLLNQRKKAKEAWLRVLQFQPDNVSAINFLNKINNNLSSF